ANHPGTGSICGSDWRHPRSEHRHPDDRGRDRLSPRRAVRALGKKRRRDHRPCDPRHARPAKKPAPPPAASAQPPATPPRPRDEAKGDRLVTAFHRVTEVIARCKTPADAANAFLDLALELVPAEAAAVFYAHIAERDLHVAAARGPSATYVRRVALGQP